jgi:hypothetical protein
MNKFVNALSIFLCLSVATLVIFHFFPGHQGTPSDGLAFSDSNQKDIGEYTRDRARRYYGYVLDANEKPIEDATVWALDTSKARELISANPIRFLASSLAIEASTKTDSKGLYEFKNLELGPKSICASTSESPGGTASFVVVQEGVGGRNDIALNPGKVLNISIPDSLQDTDFIAIGSRWWPTPIRLAPGDGSFKFFREGNAFDSGAIFALRDGIPVAVASFGDGETVEAEDFVEWDNEKIESENEANSNDWLTKFSKSEIWHQGEMLGTIVSWKSEGSEFELAEFCSVLSPLAALVADLRGGEKQHPIIEKVEKGQITGVTVSPYAPVWIENLDTKKTSIAYASQASEFFSKPVFPGKYVIRTLGFGGKPSHSKGVSVYPGESTEVLFNRLEVWSEDDEKGHILGYVDLPRSEVPKEYAVIIQDQLSFRKYLKRVELDEQGFFSFRDVPLDRHYFSFCQKSDQEIKQNRKTNHFAFLNSKEMWIDMEFSNNQLDLTGQLRDGETVVGTHLSEEGATVEIFEQDSLEKDFQITNLPVGKITLSLRSGDSDISQLELDFDQATKLRIRVNNGILKK